MKKIVFSVVALSAMLLVAGCTVPNKNAAKDTGIGTDAAKAKVEKLIADSGGAATVKDATIDGDLYKITISANGQDQPVYITKDGTKFIQSAVTFEDIEKQQAEQKKKQEDAAKPAPKNDSPAVDLYVMAFCPYGNKAEDTIKPVYNLLKNKANFNFHYIVSVEGDTVSSLHGQKEVDQDEREVCVLKNYGKDQWMNFVTYVNDKCGSDGSCWEAGAKSLSIDTAKISACVSSDGLALMKENADASNAAGASGSPTMIINGQTSQAVYKYGDSESYKQAICDAFNTAPSECSQKLSSIAPATSAATQGGSCGS
jgi:hypothetical protein